MDELGGSMEEPKGKMQWLKEKTDEDLLDMSYNVQRSEGICRICRDVEAIEGLY